ncbi:tRNA (uridine(54)-C5)-methyltransferase TrmA [Parahaliea mediterranea]|uniref:tRNA/tmRNA (uracil-C(5))-methyltransferase n=1 Tax=Parahaliea mediterranea TaxID=651086 RepID=A0A939IN55_9GAMM|nr:tRNA (uridine(54)-C5)-methyltransferase TrmA [Parahaliea mediterranea]MBN7797748.1 tRNA (uridine(54)-C5)-methyltransferase TrmA [Parahaliea mediterranea]
MPLSNFDPSNYETLLAGKVAAVSELLAPYSPPAPAVFRSAPEAFRMRAEFRMWHDGDALDYVMFRPDAPKVPVAISHFPIACDTIQALMPVLRERLGGDPLLRRKLFQVEFLSTLAGDTLVTLIYHRKLEDDWRRAAESLARELGIALVGRSRKQKVVLDRDYVTEVLPVAGRDYHYRQYEQAFTQPNARVNIHMLEWALDAARPLDGDLLELYCGNGNFTLPLATTFDQVIATEMAKTSIRAARWNLERNAINNIQMIRLSAEEVSQAMAGERVFRRLADLPRPLRDYDLRTVFVDPPRAGLDPATVAMVGGFERILYISCNPNTLAGNLAALDASHRVERFALFDQFPYTAHMECGVVLQRR